MRRTSWLWLLAVALGLCGCPGERDEPAHERAPERELPRDPGEPVPEAPAVPPP